MGLLTYIPLFYLTDEVKKEGLPAKARIKSRKLIARIFEKGLKLHAWPLLLLYLEDHHCEEEGVAIKFGVSVSRKKIRRAVDRNLVKRRIREAFRKNRREIWDRQANEEPCLCVFYVYLADAPLPYEKVEKAVQKLNRKLLSR